MSKIALTGNASGTGTFSIAAPNSNTDRTLTLPDAAGEMYNQGNILGTVSESSGVPTGAVIERGSNANGEYARFADGTMICTIRSRYVGSSLLIAGGSTMTWTFPSTFSSTNHLCVTATNDTVSFNGLYIYTGTNLSTSGVGITNGGAASTYFNATAIGRWY